MRKLIIVIILLLIPITQAYEYTITEDDNQWYVNYENVQFAYMKEAYYCNLLAEGYFARTNEKLIDCNFQRYNDAIDIESDIESYIGSDVVSNITADNIVADTIKSHEYLYGSTGWDGTLETDVMREILNNIKVQPDGDINKATYHEKMLTTDLDGNVWERSGVVRSFIILVLQKIDEIIDSMLNRLGDTETRLSEIEQTLCNQGALKYC